MASRPYCPDCLFPLSVCLCKHVKRLKNRTEILVLQHPSEVKAAKGTVRLLELVLSHIRVYVGEQPEHFLEARTRCQQKDRQVGLLYPSAQSRALEQHTELTNQPIDTLVVIDGTWRKASKILHCNPWLNHLPAWHFDSAPSSRYQRSAKRSDSLSTLEAVSYGLQLVEEFDPTPLLTLLDNRQQKLSGQRPD
ncbi:DTW domain-containing protein [Bowmanella sp. Y26]|uniref:tRNA-uridine aminocarboxypropyltransferase n=1 Tax=Bowmanella yangjiangensis TaxID=2811230 RepID=UPI001BDC704F|nr:tRNA-uridine aminocarboxypropyltransferase [Bowmanella yangjiangensis]MBT1063872.1 DTW domain-containing protein [Bowmanella yangjiangensis]